MPSGVEHVSRLGKRCLAGRPITVWMPSGVEHYGAAFETNDRAGCDVHGLDLFSGVEHSEVATDPSRGLLVLITVSMPSGVEHRGELDEETVDRY